jgi:hypothetical protein
VKSTASITQLVFELVFGPVYSLHFLSKIFRDLEETAAKRFRQGAESDAPDARKRLSTVAT